MNKTRQARLLVIDVDGTLLTTDYQLTKATCSAVQQVSARGVQVVLASARSPRALHAIMGALGIMGVTRPIKWFFRSLDDVIREHLAGPSLRETSQTRIRA